MYILEITQLIWVTDVAQSTHRTMRVTAPRYTLSKAPHAYHSIVSYLALGEAGIQELQWRLHRYFAERRCSRGFGCRRRVTRPTMHVRANTPVPLRFGTFNAYNNYTLTGSSRYTGHNRMSLSLSSAEGSNYSSTFHNLLNILQVIGCKTSER